jgi:hypothetical protein
LIRNVFSVKDFILAQEMMTLYKSNLLRRGELIKGHRILRPPAKCSPPFISKNVACKTTTRGIYDLSKLKLSASDMECFDKSLIYVSPGSVDPAVSAAKLEAVKVAAMLEPDGAVLDLQLF